MKALLFLLEKEFRQVFRNPAILRILFILPVIQLLLLPLAADYEVKNVKICVVDYDRSPASQRLVHKITSTAYFKLVDFTDSYAKALQYVEYDKADLILQIPAAFEKNLVRENTSTLFIAINAVNGVKANLGGAYLRSVIQDFNQELQTELIQLPRQNLHPVISIASSNWYNPLMSYRLFMVPGIQVLLITIVGAFLSAINIVNEKETGTLEQINVTPIRKYQFVLGKLIPFWVLGLVVLTIGLFISWLIYDIVPVGSLVTIYVFSALYLIAVLGLGLLVSTFASTQQQSMLISLFLMMIFILLGGLFTSIESMPPWAQAFTRFNPISYFIDVMRMVVLKGSTLYDIRDHLFKILLFGLALNSLAIWNYRKRS
ncbi:ABC transporter permease [Flavihumibacter profundi]|uniref:ABC transporter permease n=1 Tax=Flavihumibacter profundi TaxID=2716883 RepID=UPI001CC75B03|nr:ABC transporter permease [Flavihumibacter profundi]MBZ5856841.1 ABC transporter permease [Flavihumibacter profundi]